MGIDIRLIKKRGEQKINGVSLYDKAQHSQVLSDFPQNWSTTWHKLVKSCALKGIAWEAFTFVHPELDSQVAKKYYCDVLLRNMQ